MVGVDDRQDGMSGQEMFFSLPGPIELTPAPGLTRAASLQMFFDLVHHLGGDPRAILERHAIDPARISDPEHHIDSSAMVAAFEHCASALDSPLFGLRLAQLQSPEVFGCVATLCRAAPDMRSALQAFVDYLPIVHSPQYELTLVEAADTVELRWYRHSDDYEAYQQVNHHALLRIVNLFRSAVPQGLRIRYANSSAGAPRAGRGEIEATVGCPVHFDQPVDAIGFAASAVAAPLITANPVIYHLVGSYLQRVKAARQLSLKQRVETYVRAALRGGDCSAARCARKLGMPLRTLQHQLREVDESFSDIVDRQRRALAQSYLATGQHSLGEIAAMLGYAEQTSFGRAFKKWTGHSPSHFTGRGVARNDRLLAPSVEIVGAAPC